ncbi:hypothetical protein Tco_0593561 [Tanacetum coccineum]
MSPGLPVEEVPAPKKKATKRRQSKKVIQNDDDKRWIQWTTKEEIALYKAWVRISKDNVEGNGRKNDGFYLKILDHTHTNCPITRRWSAKKKGAASMTSSTFGNEDLLARLMVNEFADLTQTHKDRKSKNVEAFIEIKKREVELWAQ